MTQPTTQTGQKNAIHLPQQGLPRLFYALAVFILAGLILYVGRSILIPIVVALFLCFLMISLKSTIRAIPMLGKLLPEWLSFVLSYAVVAFVLFTLAEIIRANADDLVAAMPAYQARLAELMSQLIDQIKGISFLPDDFMNGFDQLREQALGLVRSFATELGTTIRSFAANLVTILLYTVFMLIERGKFLNKLALIAGPDDDRLDVDRILNDIGNLVRQYISIKTFTAFIVATVSWVIMMVLGIDFAGFWALLIFSLSYIPIIGAVLAVMLPSTLALVQPDGGGVTLFLLTIGLLTVTEQCISSLIEPRLMGRSLNLSPFIILLSLSIWGSIWGFAGMLLCVPITVGVMIILSQFEDTRFVAIMLSDNGEISPIRRYVQDTKDTDPTPEEAVAALKGVADADAPNADTPVAEMPETENLEADEKAP